MGTTAVWRRRSRQPYEVGCRQRAYAERIAAEHKIRILDDFINKIR